MVDHLLLGLGSLPNNANNANANSANNLEDNLEDNFEAMVNYELKFLILRDEDHQKLRNLRQQLHNLYEQDRQERRQDQ
jgi:hypothetical protein